MTDHPRVEVRSRADLRAWLADHHEGSGSVWLVTWRKGTPHHVPRDEVVRELICWGWVDSLPRKLDAERTMLRISPRGARSAWSAVNKAHVETARAEGAMTPAGEAAVARARENGRWEMLDAVDRLEVPDDLVAALGEAGGRDGWEAQPPNVRRGTLEWIVQAVRPETRAARVEDAARSAARGERARPYRR